MTETKPPYLTANTQAPAGAYRDRFNAVAAALDILYDQAETTRRQILPLEQTPMANASIYFDPDRHGEKTIMKLEHRAGSPTAPDTYRNREYIGADPERQAEARARVERWVEYINLKEALGRTEAQISDILDKLSALESAAKERWPLPK